MQILRDPQIISGFLYNEPVTEIPEITHCGEALCCRGHALPIHQHAGFEFLYLSRGSASWRVGPENVEQSMGELLIIYPGELHRTGARANPENQHLWLGLRLECWSRAAAALAVALTQSRRRLLAEMQEVEPILRLVIAQVATLRHQRPAAIRALIDAFLALVAQRLEDIYSTEAEPRPPLPYSMPVQRAIDYMKRHPDRRLPLAEIAHAARVRSVSHFCSQFHREVGVAPAAHHLALRMELAREVLRQPAFDITTVAMQFGFSSSQHFSTAFRRAFATTPRQWRRRPGYINSTSLRPPGSPPPGSPP